MTTQASRMDEFERQTNLALDLAERRRKEIESLHAHNDKLYADYTNERILRYTAEAERDEAISTLPQAVRIERNRCVKIARDYQMSPVAGKAIAALILRRGE